MTTRALPSVGAGEYGYEVPVWSMFRRMTLNEVTLLTSD